MLPIANLDILILLWFQKNRQEISGALFYLQDKQGAQDLLDQPNENPFNLSFVILPHFYYIISFKMEMVTHSSLSMFLLSASACALYFRGIQKTDSLTLKTDVISKIFSLI